MVKLHIFQLCNLHSDAEADPTPDYFDALSLTVHR